MKLMIIAGTRPEIIKCAPIYLLSRQRGVEIVFCNTGQHREMAEQAFSIFGFQPDMNLELMTANQTLNELTHKLFKQLPPVLDKIRPDFVLVQGDTSTAAVSAQIAFNMKIRVGHIEAGLRTYNKNEPYPEEVNRRIIGLLSEVNFCPTEPSANNLKREMITENVHIVGNTIVDALEYIKRTEALEVPPGIRAKIGNREFVLVTAHRRESFGTGIINICRAIKILAERHPEICFLYPVHLNPNINHVVYAQLSGIGNVVLTEPVNYIEILSLIKHSRLCMSDSGGIQEEAPSFDKYVVVMRNFTERIESVQKGYSYLAGTDVNSIVSSVSELLDNEVCHNDFINPYGDGHSSERIIDILSELR